jgi:hypothetical protein
MIIIHEVGRDSKHFNHRRRVLSLSLSVYRTVTRPRASRESIIFKMRKVNNARFQKKFQEIFDTASCAVRIIISRLAPPPFDHKDDTLYF